MAARKIVDNYNLKSHFCFFIQTASQHSMYGIFIIYHELTTIVNSFIILCFRFECQLTTQNRFSSKILRKIIPEEVVSISHDPLKQRDYVE